MYMQANNLGGLGEFDWGQLLDTAVKGYTTIQSQKTAAQQTQALLDLQRAQQQQNALIYANNPQYSAAYSGAGQTSNLLPLLMIGGAALLLVFLMKD